LRVVDALIDLPEQLDDDVKRFSGPVTPLGVTGAPHEQPTLSGGLDLNAQDEMLDLIIEGVRPYGAGDPSTVAVDGGVIHSIGSDARQLAAGERIDGNGGIIFPSFVEPHIHLDKTLTRQVPGANVPSWEEAEAAQDRVKRTFTPEDVESRASRAIELAITNGVGLMRAHVDIDTAQELISLEGVLRARRRWADAIEIEIVALVGESIVEHPEIPDLAREAMRRGADLIGGIPNFEEDSPGQLMHLEAMFDIAEEFGTPVDAHVDFDADPSETALEMLADLTFQRGFEGRVLASHCCALAAYPQQQSERVIEKVRNAGITVCISPATNLQQVGSVGRLPVHRGSSRTKELLDAGVNVAAGTDNMNDMWFAFGRLDPVETAFVAILSAALRTEGEVAAGLEMVTDRAARALRRSGRTIEVGAPADLVVLEAEDLTDVLRGLSSRRVTIKGGKPVGGTATERWASSVAISQA
jgi:cytosine deaminase